MSPLTTSYFTCWAFFDAAVGRAPRDVGNLRHGRWKIARHRAQLSRAHAGHAGLLPVGAAEVSLVFTTPYVLRGASESDWIAYLDRALGAAKGDANKTVAVLKYGVDWSEYIFAGYAGHVTEAIFLEGLPDLPTSLPHDSPRTR